jgi:hypothetical protein
MNLARARNEDFQLVVTRYALERLPYPAAQATTGQTVDDACPQKTGDPNSTSSVRRLNCSQRRRVFGVVRGAALIA